MFLNFKAILIKIELLLFFNILYLFLSGSYNSHLKFHQNDLQYQPQVINIISLKLTLTHIENATIISILIKMLTSYYGHWESTFLTIFLKIKVRIFFFHVDVQVTSQNKMLVSVLVCASLHQPSGGVEEAKEEEEEAEWKRKR